MDLVLSCVDNYEARITINQVGGRVHAGRLARASPPTRRIRSRTVPGAVQRVWHKAMDCVGACQLLAWNTLVLKGAWSR